MEQGPYELYKCVILNVLPVLEKQGGIHKTYAKQMHERVERVAFNANPKEYKEAIIRLGNLLSELNHHCSKYQELAFVLPFLQVSSAANQKPQ